MNILTLLNPQPFRLTLVAVFLSISVATPSQADIEITKIGNPIFEPSELAFGIVTLPRSATGGDDFRRMTAEWRSAALGDHHVLDADPDFNLLLPGEPHEGPYDQEVRRAFAAHGQLQTDVLLASETRGAKTLQHAFALIPTADAPLGNSPDGESVPIIPDYVYPLWESTSVKRNGVNVSTNSNPTGLVALSDEGEVIDENGNFRDYTGLSWSHQVIGRGFGAPPDTTTAELVGDWELRYELLDRSRENGWEIITRWEVKSRASGVEGDLNHNGKLDIDDLNIMTQNVAIGGTNSQLDLNDDNMVSHDDVQYWVTELKQTVSGDTNLDGEVNFADFLALADGFDKPGTWSSGDFNNNELVQFDDFLLLAENFGRVPSSGITAVPEPSTFGIAMMGLLGLTASRRRRKKLRQPKTARQGSPEVLEIRRLLTSIGFTSHEIHVMNPPHFDPETELVSLTDIDGDNDIDIVTASPGTNSVAWHENLDGLGTFSEPKRTEFSSGEVLHDVEVADLNADGTMDLIVASHAETPRQQIQHQKIVWHDDFFGEASAARQIVIVDQSKSDSFLELEVVADVDSDADLDLVATISTEEVGSKLLWYENADGLGIFAEAQVIDNIEADTAFSISGEAIGLSVSAIDMDVDGDLDLLAARRVADGEIPVDVERTTLIYDGDVVWYENLDGKASFGDPNAILEARVDMLPFAVDLNGDDVPDPFVASRGPTTEKASGCEGPDRYYGTCRSRRFFLPYEISLLTTSSGNETYSEQQIIAEHANVAAFLSADLDGDGDNDLVAATGTELFFNQSYSLFWYENIDGGHTFHQHEITSRIEYKNAVFDASVNSAAGDIDGDGDLDLLVVSGEGEISWYENRFLGDADGNGEVAFADFLILAENFGKHADAIWADGDFNHDGKVEFADFLILAENYGKTSLGG